MEYLGIIGDIGSKFKHRHFEFNIFKTKGLEIYYAQGLTNIVC
jgi:hypothetical protein